MLGVGSSSVAPEALALFEQMELSLLEPSVVSYGALVSALDKAIKYKIISDYVIS